MSFNMEPEEFLTTFLMLFSFKNTNYNALNETLLNENSYKLYISSLAIFMK